MRRLRVLKRMVAAVVLVLGAAVTVILPVADAYAEQDAAGGEAHVERPGSRTCPPAHDELACQICRVLRLSGHGPAAPLWLSALDTEQTAVHAADTATRPSFYITGTSSRAPPAALFA